MNDQRQHQPIPLQLAADEPDAAGSTARLAAARDQLDRIYAAADAILADIHQSDSARFLEQVRQSGGE